MSTVLIQIVIFGVILVSAGEAKDDMLEATIEMLVVLDKELSDEFLRVPSKKSEYYDMFRKIQEYYDLEEEGIRMKINFHRVKLLTNKKEQPHIGHPKLTETDNPNLELNDMDFYILEEFFRNKPWNRNYDSICFITNKHLLKGGLPILGFSYKNGTCNTNNVMISLKIPDVIGEILSNQMGLRIGSDYMWKDLSCSEDGSDMDEDYMEDAEVDEDHKNDDKVDEDNIETAELDEDYKDDDEVDEDDGNNDNVDENRNDDNVDENRNDDDVDESVSVPKNKLSKCAIGRLKEYLRSPSSNCLRRNNIEETIKCKTISCCDECSPNTSDQNKRTNL